MVDIRLRFVMRAPQPGVAAPMVDGPASSTIDLEWFNR